MVQWANVHYLSLVANRLAKYANTHTVFN